MQSSFFVALPILLLSAGSIPGVLFSNAPLPQAGSALFNTAGNKIIRIFNHHSYEVVDTAYFIIYHGSKTVEKIPNKGQMTVEQYYFSKTLTDDIYELSIVNLEKVFPGNTQFHYAIEQAFRSDKDLITYDKYLQAYKVKYIFFESLTK